MISELCPVSFQIINEKLTAFFMSLKVGNRFHQIAVINKFYFCIAH